MKSIIIIFFISLILLSCSKQVINLNKEFKNELSKIKIICQTTNSVDTLCLIRNNLYEQEANNGLIYPSYACYAILEIISNNYNLKNVKINLSETNNIDSLIASSFLSMLSRDFDAAANKAYEAYLIDTNRLDLLLEVISCKIDYNRFDEVALPLIKKYNQRAIPTFAKYHFDFKYNVYKKNYDKCFSILKNIRKKYPEHELFCDFAELNLRISIKKKATKDNRNNSKKIFELCKILYNNGYKDTWFGIVLGRKALAKKNYKLAVDGFEMCIDLSKKYDKTFYSDNLLAFYGFALQKCGRIKEAKKVLNEALKLNPTNEYAISFLKDIE